MTQPITAKHLMALLTLTFVLPTFAQINLDKPIDFTKHHLVKVSLESAEKSFAPLPAKGSKTEQADYTEILKWQKTRTAADCALAKRESNIKKVYDFFGPDYKVLSAAQTQALETALNDAVNEEIDYLRTLKDFYKRPRPYDANPQIQPCAEKEKSLAYPSGHAASSRFIAHALAAADPKNAEKYFARADEVALNRVRGGVHHPSDIAAGKAFGDYFWQQAELNDEFKKTIESLGKSLAAH